MVFSSFNSKTRSKKIGYALKQSPLSFEKWCTNNLNQGHPVPLKFIKMNSGLTTVIFQINFLPQPLTFMLDQKENFPFHLNHLLYHQLMSHLFKSGKILSFIVAAAAALVSHIPSLYGVGVTSTINSYLEHFEVVT